ncbi:MAG: hypothetical protein WCZ02_09500, partial [Lysobacterales bacterium]
MRKNTRPHLRNQPMAEPRKRKRNWIITLVLAALLLGAWLVAGLRGPVLPGYPVQNGPLVQNVVATGRVASPSRVQVGAEITGLV